VDGVEIETVPADNVYAVQTEVHFADGTKLSAQFWRLIESGRSVVSIFDHRQRYGLPSPVDAIGQLAATLAGRRLSAVELDRTTGDLQFTFEGDVLLQVFNFTGYEIWQVRFPDGALELSNYVLSE
jgi:hypothetical protein